MSFEKNTCEICGCEYEYDTEASPAFCDTVCSQGCREAQKDRCD